MTHSASDSNLLYGLLALNADYVTREQMIEAMQAWMLNKSRSLGDILVEKDFLKPSRRALLDILVADYVEKHDGDVHQSLAAVPVDESVRHELTLDLQDGDVQASLGQVEATQTLPPERVQRGAVASRFRVVRFHSRGGLGQVYLANDRELHREVALKEMREKVADNPANQMKFVLEAQVTGGLEHPGIVPVYGMGTHPDGRPYYAMRFIRGGELTDAVDEFHRQGGKNSEIYLLELHKLLRRIVAACDAIAYAHSRGVLHRDLKPRNIMVGKFGETLVVDWGLAMLSGQQDATLDREEGVLQPPSASGSSREKMGTLIGTVRYMSPEQACGNVQLFGPATDVYGLGATLFYVLTGRPPILEVDMRVAIEQAKHGKFPRPRELDHRIPRPLEAICLKAMALNPSDRYPSARDLADDIEKWFADHSVSAYTETIHERAARWVRHHWVHVQATAAALIVIALVSTLAAISTHRAKESEREAKQLALGNFRQARDAVDAWLTGPAEDLREYPVMAGFRRQILTKAAEDYQKFANQSSNDIDVELERARTLLRLGQLRGMLQDYPAAESCFRKAESLLLELRKRSNLDDIRLELGNSRTSLANLLMELGRHDAASQLYDAAKEEHRRLRADTGSPEHMVALAISLTNKGKLSAKLDLLDDARAELEQAIAEFQAAISAKPDAADYRSGLSVAMELLGAVFQQTGRLEDAESLFRNVINDTTQQLGKNKENAEAVHSRADAQMLLSDALSNTGRYHECLLVIQEAIADYQSLADVSPDYGPRIKESMAKARTQLGQILYKLGTTSEAKAEFELAEKLLTELVEANRIVPRYQEALAACKDSRAQLLMELDQFEEAKVYSQEALALFSNLLTYVQPLRTYRHRAGIAYSHLGQIQHRLGQYAEAHDAFKNAISIMSSLLDERPEVILENDMAQMYVHWGALFWDEDDKPSSRLSLQNALNRWRNLSDNMDLPECCHHLARVLILGVNPELRDPNQAVVYARKAVEAAADNADYAGTLGAALYRAGQLDAARKRLEEATELRHRPHCFDLFFLAMTLADVGESEQAKAKHADAVFLFEEHHPGNLDYQRLFHEVSEHLTDVTQPGERN